MPREKKRKEIQPNVKVNYHRKMILQMTAGRGLVVSIIVFIYKCVHVSFKEEPNVIFKNNQISAWRFDNYALQSGVHFSETILSLRVEIFLPSQGPCSYARFFWKLFFSQFILISPAVRSKPITDSALRCVYKVCILAQAENWVS